MIDIEKAKIGDVIFVFLSCNIYEATISEIHGNIWIKEYAFQFSPKYCFYSVADAMDYLSNNVKYLTTSPDRETEGV